MECRTTGIILRTRPLTESSLIVHWLTSDFGRVATVAKGARRPKSPFRGKLDLFHCAQLLYQRSQRSDLHNLREVNVENYYLPLRQDLAALEQASFFTRLIERSTEIETPIQEIYDLLSQALNHIVTHPPEPLAQFAFEIKLLAELGLRPKLEEASITDGAKHVLAKLLSLPWPELHRVKLSTAQNREIETYLANFITHHIGPLR